MEIYKIRLTADELDGIIPPHPAAPCLSYDHFVRTAKQAYSHAQRNRVACEVTVYADSFGWGAEETGNGRDPDALVNWPASYWSEAKQHPTNNERTVLAYADIWFRIWAGGYAVTKDGEIDSIYERGERESQQAHSRAASIGGEVTYASNELVQRRDVEGLETAFYLGVLDLAFSEYEEA